MTWTRRMRSARDVLRYILDNPSNEGQRAYRLGLALGWQVYKRTVGLPIIVPLDGGARYVADPRSGNATGVIYTRLYEPEYTMFLRKHIVPGGIMVDVGAHTGLFALMLAGHYRRAVCFEPAPDNLELLRRNVALNPQLVIDVVVAAVGSHEGTARLHLAGSLSGMNRVDDAGELEVPLTTVDASLEGDESVSLLKVDVEGGEVAVLDGARSTLRRSPTGLALIENHDAAPILSILREVGWSALAIDKRGRPSAAPSDLRNAYNLIGVGPGHPLARDHSVEH